MSGRTGRIILGYPGIGKSTAAKYDKSVIDLDSSYFSDNGNKWYISYCWLAVNLIKNNHNRTVFISTHKEVQEYFKEIVDNNYVSDGIEIYVCYPSLELKNEWIEKLKMRYNKEKETETLSIIYSDYLSYKRAEKHFEEDIKNLSNSKFNKIIIDDMNYNLAEILD